MLRSTSWLVSHHTFNVEVTGSSPVRSTRFRTHEYIYNKMKKCSKCGLEKENLEFNKHSNSRDGLTSWCKTCVKEYTKKDYENNKEKYITKHKTIRKEKKRWVDEIKSTLKCEKCGENHIATLDFHHIDPNEKEFGIARNYFSKEKILKEIEKCVVLCSNCHRKLHWEEKQI